MPSFENRAIEQIVNKEIANKGELHLICAIGIDSSSSMNEEQVKKGLEEMKKAIESSPQAMGRVEFCIICFNNNAKVLEPFGPMYDFEVPEIRCEGMTAMHEAVDLMMDVVEKRKAEYKDFKTPYYRPWIYLLTDGKPNDIDNGSFERLIEYINGKHATFFPVAIGEYADIDLLKKLANGGPVLKASVDSFKETFVWLSNSLVKVSNSTQSEKVVLDNPSDYQISVIS